MSDNPPPALSVFTALPDHRVLTLEGRDAKAFAHAQFMNDVAALTPGQWQWNGWLTPKGRVIALFALVLLDDASVCLVLADVDPAQLAVQLQGFVFRARVTVAVRTDRFVAGAWQAAPASGNAVFGTSATGLMLDLGGQMPRTLRIGPASAPDDVAACDRWKAADIVHGLPRLPPSQATLWTPQQLSLERLRAYSVKKGCYPGQEIVARTHFLGQAKRGLALFDADTVIPEGTEVLSAGVAIGTVVSVAASAHGARVLAVLPLSHGDRPLTAGGSMLREQPLQDGLAR